MLKNLKQNAFEFAKLFRNVFVTSSLVVFMFGLLIYGLYLIFINQYYNTTFSTADSTNIVQFYLRVIYGYMILVTDFTLATFLSKKYYHDPYGKEVKQTVQI